MFISPTEFSLEEEADREMSSSARLWDVTEFTGKVGSKRAIQV